jgi:hypothetical protein
MFFWRLDERTRHVGIAGNVQLKALDLIPTLDPAILDEACEAASSWLDTLIAKEEHLVQANQIPFIEVWKRLVECTEIRATSGDRTYSASQGEALMHDVANSAIGILAQSGLRLLDLSRRKPEEFDFLARKASTIVEFFMRAQGTARLIVATPLTQWLHLMINHLPDLTSELVLQPIEQGDEGLVLLDVYALYGRGWNTPLYDRLAPILLREIKASRLSSHGVTRLASWLTWAALDHLEDLDSIGPDQHAMRVALQQTSEDARTGAIRTLRNWLQHGPEAPLERWNVAVELFLDKVWPLDASLRTPEISREIAEVPAILGDHFPVAVRKVVTMLVPFHLWTVDRLFRFPEDDDPARRRERAARHWPEALALVDTCLGLSPEFVPHDLSIWLTSFADFAPPVTADLRFRRLVRLSQR